MKLISNLTLFFILLNFVYYIFQNKRNRIGGKISFSKNLWLFYCIYTWFFLLPLSIYLLPLPQELKMLWGMFSIWMWIRGIAELYMLFVSKNWVPPIGISHTSSSLFLLLIGSFYYDHTIIALPIEFKIFHLSIILSLILEVYYAVSFFKIIGTKSKGDHGVWFATAQDPKFKKILIITSAGNIVLYSCLAIFLYKIYYMN
jgi:hypothetical protein